MPCRTSSSIFLMSDEHQVDVAPDEQLVQSSTAGRVVEWNGHQWSTNVERIVAYDLGIIVGCRRRIIDIQ